MDNVTGEKIFIETKKAFRRLWVGNRNLGRESVL